MPRELRLEFFPAARILELKLDARRPMCVSLCKNAHALGFYPRCRHLDVAHDLVARSRVGRKSTSGDHQRTDARRVVEGCIEGREGAHGNADEVSSLDSEMIHNGDNIGTES